jgi:hypothetical protein
MLISWHKHDRTCVTSVPNGLGSEVILALSRLGIHILYKSPRSEHTSSYRPSLIVAVVALSARQHLSAQFATLLFGRRQSKNLRVFVLG